MKKIKGKIYNFYPVVVIDEESFMAVEKTWQWALFGWWFEMYTRMRAITALARCWESNNWERQY